MYASPDFHYGVGKPVTIVAQKFVCGSFFAYFRDSLRQADEAKLFVRVDKVLQWKRKVMGKASPSAFLVTFIDTDCDPINGAPSKRERINTDLLTYERGGIDTHRGGDFVNAYLRYPTLCIYTCSSNW